MESNVSPIIIIQIKQNKTHPIFHPHPHLTNYIDFTSGFVSIFIWLLLMALEWLIDLCFIHTIRIYILSFFYQLIHFCVFEFFLHFYFYLILFYFIFFCKRHNTYKTFNIRGYLICLFHDLFMFVSIFIFLYKKYTFPSNRSFVSRIFNS